MGLTRRDGACDDPRIGTEADTLTQNSRLSPQDVVESTFALARAGRDQRALAAWAEEWGEQLIRTTMSIAGEMATTSLVNQALRNCASAASKGFTRVGEIARSLPATSESKIELHAAIAQFLPLFFGQLASAHAATMSNSPAERLIAARQILKDLIGGESAAQNVPDRYLLPMDTVH